MDPVRQSSSSASHVIEPSPPPRSAPTRQQVSFASPPTQLSDGQVKSCWIVSMVSGSLQRPSMGIGRASPPGHEAPAGQCLQLPVAGARQAGQAGRAEQGREAGQGR